MARQVLTNIAIERIKAAAPNTRDNHWDAVVPSLALRVTSSGHKSWIVQRRTNGRMLRVKLGDFPALGLADARAKARAAIEQMLEGRDPRQSQRRVTAAAARSESFETAVEDYIRREVTPNRRLSTQSEIARTLRKRLVPRWGTLNLSEITARDILEVLDDLADEDKLVSANRVYSVIRRFFRWAVERQVIASNPAASLRKPHRETARSRYLTDEEIRQLWLKAPELGWPFGPYVQTLLLTGQRRTEVSAMAWNEIDLAARQWILPPARTKNGLEHVIPVSDALLEILSSAPTADSRKGFVFSTTGHSGVSGFARAKRRLDKLLTPKDSSTETFAPWVLHDLRRSAATGMGRIGVLPHVIEAVLNHSNGFRAGVAGVYMRHPYLEESADALKSWANHITQLAKKPPSNVVSFPARSPAKLLDGTEIRSTGTPTVTDRR